MLPNEFIQSPNGKYQLQFTLDRRLIVQGPKEYINDGVLYVLNTGFPQSAYVELNDSGFMVSDGMTSGSSRTFVFGAPKVMDDLNAYGRMQDDGNFVVYTPGGKPLWDTGTWFGAAGCPVGDKPSDAGTLRGIFASQWSTQYPGNDPKVAWDYWCDCKFMPGNWKDIAGTDARTRCKRPLNQGWAAVGYYPGIDAPWTEWGGGQRNLPTGGGLLQAFASMVREPTEEELELDYVTSLMFTDVSRWAGIIAYCGLRAGGPLFFGPLGLAGTAVEGLISLISAPFDEGKRLRYLAKMADVWFNIGLPMILAGLSGAILIGLACVAVVVVAPAGVAAGAAILTAGAALGGLGITAVVAAAYGVTQIALLFAMDNCLKNAALRIEERYGSFLAPWNKRWERNELKWTEAQRAAWKPSTAALERAKLYWYPAQIGVNIWAKNINPLRLLDPVANAWQDACELASSLIPQTTPPNKDIASTKLFIRALGQLGSPLSRAVVNGKPDAIASEETWQTVGDLFDVSAKNQEDAETKEKFTDLADFFKMFKPSFSRAVSYVFNPTPDNFSRMICCENDSAFDRMPQSFIGQNMSSLKRSLAAILGEVVDGKKFTVEERAGLAAALMKLNGDNFAKLLRLISRILGFFNEALGEIRKLNWGILNGVLDFLRMLLTSVAGALMQARAFILSLISQVSSANLPPPPAPSPAETPPKKKVTVAKSEDDGLLAALLLGAGGGFVLGGPPGALVGAGAAVALSSK